MAQSITYDEFLEILEDRVKGKFGEQRFARDTGVARSHLYEVRKGRCKPSPRLCIALGYQRVTVFVKVTR